MEGLICHTSIFDSATALMFSKPCLRLAFNSPSPRRPMINCGHSTARTTYGVMRRGKPVSKILYRVTKLRGVVVWIVSDQTIKGSESGTSFRQALFAKQCGFRLHDTMIWKKRAVHFPDSARYYNVFEYMFIWSKGRPIFNPLRDRANKTAGAHVRSVIGRRRDGTKENMISKKKASCGFYVKAHGVRFNVWEIDAGNNKSHSDALERSAFRLTRWGFSNPF